MQWPPPAQSTWDESAFERSELDAMKATMFFYPSAILNIIHFGDFWILFVACFLFDLGVWDFVFLMCFVR